MAIAARPQQSQRPRLLQAVLDAWSQEEVRAKVAFVFAMLVIFRFVAHIPIPGVNPELLKRAFEGDNGTGAFREEGWLTLQPEFLPYESDDSQLRLYDDLPPLHDSLP